MSENEKNITVFLPDGSQKVIVVKPGTKGLTDRDRANVTAEE